MSSEATSAATAGATSSLASSLAAPIVNHLHPMFEDWDTNDANMPQQDMPVLTVQVIGTTATGVYAVLQRLQTPGLFGNRIKSRDRGGLAVEELDATFGKHSVRLMGADVTSPGMQKRLGYGYSAGTVWVVDAMAGPTGAVDASVDRSVAAFRYMSTLQSSAGVYSLPLLVIATIRSTQYSSSPASVVAAAEFSVGTAFALPGYVSVHPANAPSPYPRHSDHTRMTGARNGPTTTRSDLTRDAITDALSSAIALPPLLAIILAYCTIESEFIRLIAVDLGISGVCDKIKDGMEWLMHAIYERKRRRPPYQPMYCSLQ